MNFEYLSRWERLIAYFTRQLAIAVVVLVGISPHSSHASPGATVPWTTYEAEDMMINGGAIIGPPALAVDKNAIVADVVEMESSGGKCVKLSATGQSVQFTAQAAANSVVVRYSVPDSADGQGIDSTLSLYLNGKFVQKLAVTSKYSWLYGSYTFSNDPKAGTPRNFYDEVRLKGLSIGKGDVVRLERDADDTAAYYIIDLVDLENVAAPLAVPSNSRSMASYGAVGDGIADDTAALKNCIAGGNGGIVWVPPGTYLITSDINVPAGTTIQGAGMWQTTFVGDAGKYTDANERVRFSGGGDNIHLADFAIIGKLNHRNDGEPNDGLDGYYGTGSTISRIWGEHTKTGAWIVNSSGLIIDGCRFRDTVADGINVCAGMQGTIVTNCTTRGTGDDCFAIWPATYLSPAYAPGMNVITHCTGQAPFLANGSAIYGGESNRIEDCLFKDVPYGCGILIAGTFPIGKNGFSGTTVAQRSDLIRCGGYDPGWRWRAALQLCPHYINISGVNINNINITDSLSYAVGVVSPGSSATKGVLSNAAMNSVNVSTYGVGVPPYHAASPSQADYVDGVFGVWARNDARGSLAVSHLTVNGLAITSTPTLGDDLKNQSNTIKANNAEKPQFAFNFNSIPVSTNVIAAVPTDLTAIAGYGQVTLNWSTSPGAVSYNVKRATIDGGPYTTIATAVAGLTNINTKLANGTTYYYVVSSVNGHGESSDSSQAGATPSANSDLALNKPVTVSSVADDSPAANAVDGDTGTRWSSEHSDPQWIYVDLGDIYSIKRVKLNWETAYGQAYQIQVSSDAATWKTIYATTNATGGVNDLTGLSGSGRYVRMYGTARGTSYGYSLWELEVYGTAPATPPS